MKIENLLVRQLINEFLGTAVLIVVGDSIMAIIIAGGNEPIAAIVGPVGWGVAIFCAVSVAGGVSAHLNPAVTLASASVRKFPLAKVPLYFAAQYMGAFVGAALVFVTYRDLINHFDNGVRQVTGEKGTAGIFATYPKEHVSTLTCFIDQVIATGVMVLTAESIVDERNFGGLPKFLHPTALGLMIMAIIFSFAYNCMCPLNPARDLGPRLFTLMAGWSAETFTYGPVRHPRDVAAPTGEQIRVNGCFSPNEREKKGHGWAMYCAGFSSLRNAWDTVTGTAQKMAHKKKKKIKKDNCQ